MKKTLLLLALASASSWGAALVLQTDFGTKDGAVAAMKGVAFGVDGQLPIFDLTHDIPPMTSGRAATGSSKPTATGRPARFSSASSTRASAPNAAPSSLKANPATILSARTMAP